MRIVVTGGCGYVGSAVVRALVERGDHVLNIDSRRKTAPVPALAPIAGRETHVRLESTIKDAGLLKALLHEFKPDRVIHLASSLEPDSAAVFETEIATTLAVLTASRDYAARLADAARAGFRVVQAVRLPRPSSEAAPVARALAQRAAEALASNWCRANDLALVTCMADEVFGPWQRDDALLPRVLSTILLGAQLDLPNAGQSMRDFLPIADFAQGLLRAAERGRPHACYELSAGAERCEVDVVEAAVAILDRRRPHPSGSWGQFVRKGGRPSGDAFIPMLDPSTAERDLGWNPGNFYDGLARMTAWAVSQAQLPREASPAQVIRSAAE